MLLSRPQSSTHSLTVIACVVRLLSLLPRSAPGRGGRALFAGTGPRVTSPRSQTRRRSSRRRKSQRAPTRTSASCSRPCNARASKTRLRSRSGARVADDGCPGTCARNAKEEVARLAGRAAREPREPLEVLRPATRRVATSDLDRVTSVYSKMPPRCRVGAHPGKRRARCPASRLRWRRVPVSLPRNLAVAEQTISRPLDEQLQLGRRANSLQASIDDGLKAVGAAITSLRPARCS